MDPNVILVASLIIEILYGVKYRSHRLLLLNNIRSHVYAMSSLDGSVAVLLNNPSVAGPCVLVQHQDRVLWPNEMYWTASGQACCQYADNIMSFHESISLFAGGSHAMLGSVFHWKHRNRFVYNKTQPISSGTEQAWGPVELWDEGLCQRCDSVLNLVWMWPEAHRKEPLVPRSFLLSPGPICCPRFVVDVILYP